MATERLSQQLCLIQLQDTDSAPLSQTPLLRPVLRPDFEQKRVLDLISDFFSAQNLIIDLVGVMEFGHYLLALLHITASSSTFYVVNTVFECAGGVEVVVV